MLNSVCLPAVSLIFENGNQLNTSPASPKASARFSKVSAQTSPLSPDQDNFFIVTAIALILSYFHRHNHHYGHGHCHGVVLRHGHRHRRCHLHPQDGLPAALARIPLSSVNTSTVSTNWGTWVPWLDCQYKYKYKGKKTDHGKNNTIVLTEENESVTIKIGQ